MIEVDHLSKYYGPNAAVRNITFSVDKGEILGFLGPNGAGKSTTMRIITGYLPASAGTVRVDGYDVASDSLEVRRRIGYLPESVPLYTDMSVYDYLNYMGQLKEISDSKVRKNRVWEVMEQTNIDDVAHRLIGRLSRGYRQRVGLAQALIHNPEVLILDEPTVGLDPRQIIEIRELIKSLGQDHTVILSTHILPEVSMICSRVVIINRGRLVALDTPLNLAENVEGASRVQVTVRGPQGSIESALRGINGVTNVELQNAATVTDNATTFEVVSGPHVDLRAQVAKQVVANNWDLLELKLATLDLEQIFLRVTSSEEPDVDELTPDDFLDSDEEIDEESDYPVAAADEDAEISDNVDYAEDGVAEDGESENSAVEDGGKSAKRELGARRH